MKTQHIEDLYGLTVTQKQPLAITHGQGVWVWDEHGRRLLDCTSGWGVTCLGHSHPVITQAITEQAGKIIQNPNSGFTYSPARSALLQELVLLLPAGMSRVWFANSGAEANDAALKIARKVTGRQAVVAVRGAFHGRTLAALSVTGNSANAARYLPRLPDHTFIELNNTKEIVSGISSVTAAVILELVQGEGGVRAADRDFVAQLQRRCKETGALLIVDEVQTGFCRTGTFFACDQYDLQPDLMTLGKGIAGGLPFAALAMTQQVADGVKRGDHGGTYCGNPLACAVSLEVLRYLRQHRIAESVQQLSGHAMRELQALQQEFPILIREVRGVGLMLALQLVSDDLVWPLTDACLAQGLIVTPTRDGVVRLLPSLLITAEEWQQALVMLRAALADLWVTNQWASMQTA